MQFGVEVNFSILEFLVNNSTVPYCITMERQKQNEILCAQNLIISRNDGDIGKNHTEDGERPAATTVDREELSTIYHNIQSPKTIRGTMALVLFSSA